MAGVETIASIVGIASVGIKLAKTLYQVGYKTANANHNINRIATNVSLFASMLKHVGSVLDDAQSLHSPEAVETVKQLVKECESVFKEIADIIVLARDKSEGSKEPPAANGSKRRISMIARARWYFEGPKAEHLLAQLEYLKTTLSVLLQTLNLAALTAKINATLGQSEKPEDVVQQERLHVETLIVAQQLSVCNLKETQEKLEAESTRPSTPSDDNTADSRYPKLLTQSSETSLQMIRLGNDNLDFLDRRHSVTPADGAKLQPSTSRSEAFIEELLSRWTVQAEIEDSGASDDSDDLEEDPERQATPVPGQPKTRHDSTDSAKNKSTTSAPSLHVQPSNPTPSISTAPTIPSTLSKQWMSARSDAATVATRDRMSTRTGSTGYAATDLSSMPSRMTSPRTAMERSMTNPEADGMPTLISFHDHHALQNPQPLGYMSTPGIVPPPPRSESSASTLPAHRRALAPYMAGAAAASGNRLHPGWGNYRQPYVSDEDSTWSPSDSDESRPSSRAGTAVARTRRDSNVSSAAKRSRNAHRDSGFGGEVGDSLGIPWRIQVNPDKYFDFRDDMLVGPRTPYLPSEPRSWIYLQPSASTEIAKKWVCEEALIEMRYPHNEFRETHDAPAIAAQHGGWRILQPLKFHEIEALVNHTVQFIDQQRTHDKKPNVPVPTTGPPAAPVRSAPQYATPPVPMPPMPPIPNRSTSYNDGHPSLPPQGRPIPRGVPWNSNLPPRDPHETPFSPRERHGRPDIRDSHNESYRDRSRERWLAQKEHERERNERKHRRKQEKREKEQPEKKKEKHKSGMGSTLAKVGTLAMLLEGLDGAF